MILVPKRKLVSGEDDTVQNTIDYIVEAPEDGERGDYDSWLKIPVGTDKYPNPP